MHSILLSGNSNKKLACSIANKLHIPLGKVNIDKFNDGEIKIQIFDDLYKKNVIILQSMCHPIHNHLLELLLLAHTVSKVKPKHITAIIPYFGYARQNKTYISKTCYEPNSVQLIAKLLESAGINKIITMDVHTETICRFFHIPCINLYNTKNIIQDLKHTPLNNMTIVAPDLGSMLRTQIISNYLSCAKTAVIYKQRLAFDKTIHTKIIGKIKNRHCIIIDDIIDTAATICSAAKLLKQHHAARITVYCTHPIFSNDAIQKIQTAPINEVIVTDTIPLSKHSKQCKKIRQLCVAHIFTDFIKALL